MKKVNVIVSSTIVIIILITICILYNNKFKFINTPLEPMYKYISIQHFDNGTYEDYKKIFTNTENILSKSQFEEYRANHEVNDIFKYDSNKISGIMKHMKLEKKSDDLYRIYYMRNIKDEKEKCLDSYWIIIKKDNKWLIKN